jgi:Helix-turn-helix domain
LGEGDEIKKGHPAQKRTTSRIKSSCFCIRTITKGLYQMSIDATRFVWKLSQKAVTPTEKLILLAIADRCGERGECWPSLSRLEKDTGLDRRSIMRHRIKLIAQGILTFTGEYRGKSKQIPVMQLMIDEYREGDFIEDNEEGGQPVTGDNVSPVPGAACHRYPGQPVTQNLKEEPKRIEPKKTLNNIGVDPAREAPKKIKPIEYQQTYYNISLNQLPEDSRFEEFWDLYPKKNNKARSRVTWLNNNLDSVAEEIINKLKLQIEQDAHWKSGYIPSPSNYLVEERWLDEINKPVSKATNQPLNHDSTEWAKNMHKRLF